MCFTPLASIITAVTEFCIAAYLFRRIKDKRLYPIAVLVLFLGLYQFTEFMLCKSTNDIIWARIGFAIYTALPMLLYHSFTNLSRIKFKRFLYILPVFFGSLALFFPNFINYTSCNTFHVTVNSLIFNQSTVLMYAYLVYYFFYSIYGFYLFSKNMENIKIKANLNIAMAAVPFTMLAGLFYYVWSSINEHNQVLTWVHTSMIIIAGILVLIPISALLLNKSKKLFYRLNAMILATAGVTILLLSYLVPSFTPNYGSIFCQFALVYGIASLFLIKALNGKLPPKLKK